MRGARLAIALVFMAVCREAAAYIVIPAESSIEVAEGESGVIVRGKIFSDELRIMPEGLSPARTITLEVSEVLKGKAAERLTFVVSAADIADYGRTGDELLVMLNVEARGTQANLASDLVTAYRARSIIKMKNPQPMYRMDCTVAANVEQIVAAVRKSIDFPDHRAVYHLQPYEMPGHAGVVQLAVPADQRLERLAHQWLEHWHPTMRSRALTVLGTFATEANQSRVLEVARRDPYFVTNYNSVWSPAPEQRMIDQFIVRLDAFIWLRRHGQPNVSVRSSFYSMHYQRLSPHPKIVAAIALAFIATALLRRTKPRFGVVVNVAFALLLAGGLACWARSHRISDTISWTLGRSNIEIASREGRLALLVVHDDPPPHGLLIRSFPPERREWWFSGLLNPAQEKSWRNFHHAQGRTNQSDYAYRLLQAPWWAVAVLLALWPAWVLIGALSGALRRRYRRANNLCPHCGYNLTGNIAGRCPECGGLAVQRIGARVPGVVG